MAAANAGPVIKDANGNVLKDGDDVVVVNDLPFKGMPKPVKAGTKVKHIRLVEDDHDIDRRIEGFGAMGSKSIYVRKARDRLTRTDRPSSAHRTGSSPGPTTPR